MRVCPTYELPFRHMSCHFLSNWNYGWICEPFSDMCLHKWQRIWTGRHDIWAAISHKKTKMAAHKRANPTCEQPFGEKIKNGSSYECQPDIWATILEKMAKWLLMWAAWQLTCLCFCVFLCVVLCLDLFLYLYLYVYASNFLSRSRTICLFLSLFMSCYESVALERSLRL